MPSFFTFFETANAQMPPMANAARITIKTVLNIIILPSVLGIPKHMV
jgi:hypothetical protein